MGVVNRMADAPLIETAAPSVRTALANVALPADLFAKQHVLFLDLDKNREGLA